MPKLKTGFISNIDFSFQLLFIGVINRKISFFKKLKEDEKSKQ
jgi:hypothetical protein